MTKHKLLHCRLFPNDNSDSYKDVDLQTIKKMINYNLSY